MKKAKNYSFPLYDTCEDKIVGIISVTTAKTEKQFKRDYNKAREEWYDKDEDCLEFFIVDNLEEKGYKKVSIEMFEEDDCLDF